MTFQGWDRVAMNLKAIADAPGGRLNTGQRDSIYVLAARLPTHGMILADEVGMGKTLIAVALTRAVSEAGGRTAILVPSTLDFQWREEFRHGGVEEIPGLVKSLFSFLEAWRPDRINRPWFNESVVLISHTLANWRLGPSTPQWRFELLPMLAAYAYHRQRQTFPYGFKVLQAKADAWVGSAASSIVDFCASDASSEVRRRFEQLGSETVWREAIHASNYQEGSENRRLLSLSVGLGLGPFDLVVLDEAHKGRRKDSGLSTLLERTLLETTSCRRLCLTATPVELEADQWKQTLARIKVDDVARERIGTVVRNYGDAVRKVRLLWRTSEEARTAYFIAAKEFEAELQPFVLRRDKRQDEAVLLFKETTSQQMNQSDDQTAFSQMIDPDAYRWQHDISVAPETLSIEWRRAICAVEALSFVASMNDDSASKRLRLTFGNGHGIATLLDGSGEQAIDRTLTTDDKQRLPTEIDDSSEPSSPEPKSLEISKRSARANWWKAVKDEAVNTSSAIYDHPAILATIATIDEYQEKREKVLVFGRFTEPMRALVSLLNARAMLRALDAGTLWPQSSVGKDEFLAVEAAHRQLNRSGTFQISKINEALSRQYSRLQRRRERLRDTLFTSIDKGLLETEKEARALASAARSSNDEICAILAAAIDQLLVDDSDSQFGSDASNESVKNIEPKAVANAFVSITAALRERGEGDIDGDGKLQDSEVPGLWNAISARLKAEYGVERGRFARLMNGATELPTRRALQLAFNRQQSNPHVLVAQSLVGREGLNLQEACRVVILLHPEWNPGVVEQQIGRVDRINSHWSKQLGQASKDGVQPLPRIEICPVIFEGTYDAYHWSVLNERWDDLRAQLHGVVVPFRRREACNAEERLQIHLLDNAAPNFRPPLRSKE